MTEPELLILLGVALIAGAFGGILAGLLGVGGGIVIVPALYFALTQADLAVGMAMQVAVGTSLLTIVFTALSSAHGHWQKGAIDVALLRRWAGWIILGVVIGGGLGGIVPELFLVAFFAFIAFVVSMDMLLRSVKPTAVERHFSARLWAGSGIGAGLISALMGIGGGTISVPVLSFLGYDIRRAVGTSAAIGLIIALPGALVYALGGLGQPGLPPWSIGYVNLLAALVIIPMTMIFARLGVWLAHRLPKKALRRLFGIFLLITSLRMARDFLSGSGLL